MPSPGDNCRTSNDMIARADAGQDIRECCKKLLPSELKQPCIDWQPKEVSCGTCLCSKLWGYGRPPQMQSVSRSLVLLGEVPEGAQRPLPRSPRKCNPDDRLVSTLAAISAGLLALPQSRLPPQRVCGCHRGQRAQVCALDAQSQVRLGVCLCPRLRPDSTLPS